MRAVLTALAGGDQRASLAFDVYIHRLRREIAAMAMAIGGVDTLVFTGGVGEHSAQVRAATVDGLAFIWLAAVAKPVRRRCTDVVSSATNRPSKGTLDENRIAAPAVILSLSRKPPARQRSLL